MSNYDWFNIDPPVQRFPNSERNKKYRWNDEVETNDKKEILARELMALEGVVERLVKDVYPLKQVFSPSAPTTVTIPSANTQPWIDQTARIRELEEKYAKAVAAGNDLDVRVEELTNQLAEMEADRDYWQESHESVETERDDLAARNEELELKFEYIRGEFL